MTRAMLLMTLALSLPATFAVGAEATDEDIHAKTSNGDEVVLHPNGYWEFKDRIKAEVAKSKVAQYEQDNGCPRGTRPSFLGLGRCIPFDDPVLKRGSLSGKGR